MIACEGKASMKNLCIVSPMAWGSGAYVVHTILERHLPDYRVRAYHPYWVLFPFVLPAVVPLKGAHLVHSTPDYAIFFCRKSAPLVVTFHNYVLDGWMRAYSSWLQILHYATDLRLWVQQALRKANMVTAVSYFTARLVQEDLGSHRSIKVIYNGVDEGRFTPAPSSSSFQKEIRVFFSGNLTRRKGAHWLPDIARRLKKNVRIFYTQGLQSRSILPPDPRLQPIGPVPFEEMPALYQQMDILLMPTVREGFGLAVAEAMACGLPVAASDCSSIPELVDDGKGGFLCPVGDVEAFAEKINLLADSPNLRREMGEYNRAKVEKMFTAKRMAAQYQQLFESI